MQRILETTRTQMRPFEPSDAFEAFSWFGDPDVMRYIPFGPDCTVDETSARISRYIDHQNSKGFSKWVIIDRESRKPIGDSGFYFLPDGKRVELGYRLSRAYWGQGFATEVGQRWIEVAGEFISEPAIFAFAHPDNASSFRVMNKLGFKFIQNETFYGLDALLYSLQITNKSEQADAGNSASRCSSFDEKRMSESDWKTFRKMVPELRERYLKKTNEELKNLLLTPDQTPTERFWSTHEKITKEAKILHRCLDGHSRSRMASFIYTMLDCGLMDLDDLSQFSDELRESAKSVVSRRTKLSTRRCT